MIVATKGDWSALVQGLKTGYLACGQAPVPMAGVKRFRETDGRRLFESLKRYVSSGDFQAIVVIGFDIVLASCDRSEVLGWIDDHLAQEPGTRLVLCGVDAHDVPELNIC